MKKIESLNKDVEDRKKNQVEILELKNKTEAKNWTDGLKGIM